MRRYRVVLVELYTGISFLEPETFYWFTWSKTGHEDTSIQLYTSLQVSWLGGIHSIISSELPAGSSGEDMSFLWWVVQWSRSQPGANGQDQAGRRGHSLFLATEFLQNILINLSAPFGRTYLALSSVVQVVCFCFYDRHRTVREGCTGCHHKQCLGESHWETVWEQIWCNSS